MQQLNFKTVRNFFTPTAREHLSRPRERRHAFPLHRRQFFRCQTRPPPRFVQGWRWYTDAGREMFAVASGTIMRKVAFILHSVRSPLGIVARRRVMYVLDSVNGIRPRPRRWRSCHSISPMNMKGDNVAFVIRRAITFQESTSVLRITLIHLACSTSYRSDLSTLRKPASKHTSK